MIFVLYKDKDRQFRWTLWANNHRKIADSAEAYHNKADALTMISHIANNALTAELQDQTNK